MKRQTDVVVRLFGGKDLDTLSREFGVTAAMLHELVRAVHRYRSAQYEEPARAQ